MAKKMTRASWARAGLAGGLALMALGPARAQGPQASPARLMTLAPVSLNQPGMATLMAADRADQDGCKYIGKARWEPAPGASGFLLSANGGRFTVLRASVEVERKVCPDGKVFPARFSARFGDVMVDLEQGRSFEAGSVAHADPKAFAAAKAMR